MSDEQTPPPPSLRLKPRLKPAEGETSAAAPAPAIASEAPPPAAPAPVIAAPAAETPGSSGEAPKIRIKPRLVPVAAAEPATAPVTAASGAAPESEAPPAAAVVVPSAVAAPTDAPAAGTPSRIKLKPRAVDGAAAPAAAAVVIPAPAPVASAVAAPPPAPAPAAPPPAAPAPEPGKFKFKPKAPDALPPPVSSGMPPPAGANLPPPPGATPKLPPPPPPGMGAKAPPPFPVVAPPPTGKTTPPIPVPHLNVKEEPPAQGEEQEAPTGKVPLWKKGFFKYAVLAVLLVGSFAYRFVRDSLVQATSDTIRDKMTHKAEAPKSGGTAVVPGGGAPKAAAPAGTPAAVPNPALANKPAQATPGLSETQNAIAHAPVNAVNKAKDVVGKREGSGQGRDAVGAITDGEAPANKSAAAQTVAISSAIAPGVSATNSDVTAAAEASPQFRAFVANAKIGGVFQGTPARLLINGRTVRGGDVVESGLGITFDGIDPEKKMILFKDKAGAVVTRRY